MKTVLLSIAADLVYPHSGPVVLAALIVFQLWTVGDTR